MKILRNFAVFWQIIGPYYKKPPPSKLKSKLKGLDPIVSGTLFDVERSEIPARRSPPKAVVAYGSILFLFKYRILILAKPALSLPKGQQQQQA